MRLKPKQTALITGASSGLGESFARQLAALGLNLILVARSADKLDALARELRDQHGITVDTYPADLSRAEAVTALGKDLFGPSSTPIDLLINNAGLGDLSEFAEQTEDQVDQMLKVNIDALVKLTRAALPGMIARRSGAILNIASTAAFQPVPFFAVYAASKAFVLSFSEAVGREVEGTGVLISAFCPGWTRTNFGAHSGVAHSMFANAPTADEAVRAGLRVLERGKSVIFVKLTDRIQAKSAGLLPRSMVSRVSLGVMRPLVKKEKA